MLPFCIFQQPCGSKLQRNQTIGNYLRLPLYPDETLGERTRKWRLERGLFPRNLAKKIGVSEMTIVNWEKGKTKPVKKNLERIGLILRFELSPLSCSH
jgi:DNA-binding XRE family transcriptional regulator